VVWGDLDFYPRHAPGTGDVALTVFQSIPLDGVLIVTSPRIWCRSSPKGLQDAKTMNIPVLGVVET
jgi:Mrp family chromosome partitioning ATPase